MCFVGLGVSATDILLLSHPKGYLQTAGRFAYIMGPMTAMAAAFAATTCIATSVRKTDDRLNYVLGAASSAAIYGAWRNSLASGVNCFVYLGIAAYLKKKSVEEGWSFFPENLKDQTVVDRKKYDFSTLKGKFDQQT